MNGGVVRLDDGRRAQDRAWAEAMGRQNGVSLAPPAAAEPAQPDPPPKREPALPPLRDGQVHIGDANVGGPVGIDLARLIDGRLLIQGNSGAGKSMLLRRLFEQALGHIQQLLFDPDGEFSTLAEVFDVAVVTFADAERIGGQALAADLRARRFSAVLDLSDAPPWERHRLVADLVDGLIGAPQEHWHPMLVLIDEAQVFAPHYDQGDVAADVRKRTAAALADLMGRGRKRGLAGVIATGRIAETTKAVVSKATNVIVGRTFFDRDLERAGAVLGFTAGQAKALRTLADGEFMAIGPAIAGPRRVRFRAGPVQSRHKGERPALGAPPEVGAAGALAGLRSLSPVAPTALAPDSRIINAKAGTEAERQPGRRGRGWDASEDAIIADGYRNKLPIRAIAEKLEAAGFRRRALSGISSRARDLGLASDRARAQWCEEEDLIVTSAYAREVRIADISGLLAEAGYTRGRVSVQMRAITLGITRDRVNYWTELERAIAVAGLEADKPYREILEDLRQAGYQRGVTSLQKFAQKNNFNRAGEGWTAEQIARLNELYPTTPVRQISAELGKTEASVRTRASQLGLKQRKPWSDGERQILIDAQARGATLVEAASLIGRPYPNVARIAATMQLDFRRSRKAAADQESGGGRISHPCDTPATPPAPPPPGPSTAKGDIDGG